MIATLLTALKTAAGGVGGYVLAGGFGLVALLASLARSNGKQAQQIEDNHQQQKDAKDALQVDNEVGSLSASAVQRELHEKYDRK